RRVVQTAEHHRLIVELEPLDVGKPVGAVPASNIVSDRDNVATAGVKRVTGDDDTVDADSVIRQVAAEFGSVEVGCGRIQDVANNLELAGIVGAFDHERDHRHHAVEAGDLTAENQLTISTPVCDTVVVGVHSGAHADAHVEPSVTVDEVIAATALDVIATGAA